jgi:hypothetical protein
LRRRIWARLPYYADYIRDDPKWILMFVFGRFVAIRNLLWKFGETFVAEPSSDGTLFPGTDIDEVVRTLHTRGICTGLQVPEATVRAIRAFADRTTCFGNLDRNLPFLPEDHHEAELKYGNPILVGHFHDLIEQCPELIALRNDPVLKAIAATYLRTNPVLINSRLWWSFPTSNYAEEALNRASQERFHFDMNDWRSVKFFFYMTDVDDESGPHVYVSDSHRLRVARHQWTLFVGKTETDISAAYGERNILRLHGPAGFGFAEDPFGFHMGTVAHSKRRLIFEVEYGVTKRHGPKGGRLFQAKQ